MINREDLRLARIANLLNYAVRLRSANMPDNSSKYKEILNEIERSFQSPANNLPSESSFSERSKLEFSEEFKNQLKLNLPSDPLPAVPEEALESAPTEEIESVAETEEDRRSRVLQRIEKTFGKSHLAKLMPTPSQRSESATSETRRAAIVKLRKLEKQEEKIQKEKEELNHLLETYQSRPSSRAVTVQSILSQHRPRTSQRRASCSDTSSVISYRQKKPEKTDEVGDLIKNLFK